MRSVVVTLLVCSLGCAAPSTVSGAGGGRVVVTGGGWSAGALPTHRWDVVAAYVPDYRLHAFRADDAAGLTDVLFFSLRPRADGSLADPNELLPQLAVVLPAKRSFRALLSVGGGTRSSDFAAMALDPAARARFVNELCRVVQRHGLDGVDLDWEHLGGPLEREALGELLAALRRQLEPRGRLLTVAVNDPRDLTPLGLASVDRVHLMAYDGPRHGTLRLAQVQVELALDHGIPPGKLVLGIPLFATGPGARPPSAWREVIRRHRPGPSVDEFDGLRFNGLDTTRAKVRWLKQKQLGGLFFWELTQDAHGDDSLIHAAREELSSTTER